MGVTASGGAIRNIVNIIYSLNTKLYINLTIYCSKNPVPIDIAPIAMTRRTGYLSSALPTSGAQIAPTPCTQVKTKDAPKAPISKSLAITLKNAP